MLQIPLRPSRLARQPVVRGINFYCAAPKAESVALVGDFNNWDPNASPMERRVDGWWFANVPLTRGHHRYRFLVDGEPVLDPRAAGSADDDQMGEVSLVAVS